MNPGLGCSYTEVYMRFIAAVLSPHHFMMGENCRMVVLLCEFHRRAYFRHQNRNRVVAKFV